MTSRAMLPRWLRHLSQRTKQGWTYLPGTVPEGSLLDGELLEQLERLTLRVGRGRTNGLSGEHPSTRQSRSVEFADYRDYRPGDDFRLIDWNVYARLGQLTLRLTEATEAATLHLLLDASASMAWGLPSKFRAAQRLAAALGCVALAGYDCVSLSVLRGDRAQALPPLRGKDATGRLLRILDDLHPAGPLDLREAVHDYCRVPRRGVGVLISDLLAPHGVPEALAVLRRAGLEMTVLHLLAREEAAPQLDGPLDLVDCETGQVLTTTITGEALGAYTERFAAWTVSIQEACLGQRIGLRRCFADQPLDGMLRDLQAGGLVLG